MAQDLKICPVCETRNKVTWDFCVKCGESLAEVAVAADDAEVAPAGGEGVSVGAVLGGFGLLVGIGIVAALVPRSETTPPPVPTRSGDGSHEVVTSRNAILEVPAVLTSARRTVRSWTRS